MTSKSDTRSHPDRVGVAPRAKMNEAKSNPTPADAEIYAKAEQRMRRGKRPVISGFVVAILGIVGYCVACLSAGISEDLGTYFLENPGPLIVPTLGIIGLGTLLWLIGSFIYLSGAMDSDPDGPDVLYI